MSVQSLYGILHIPKFHMASICNNISVGLVLWNSYRTHYYPPTHHWRLASSPDRPSILYMGPPPFPSPFLLRRRSNSLGSRLIEDCWGGGSGFWFGVALQVKCVCVDPIMRTWLWNYKPLSTHNGWPCDVYFQNWFNPLQIQLACANTEGTLYIFSLYHRSASLSSAHSLVSDDGADKPKSGWLWWTCAMGCINLAPEIWKPSFN